jgi:hypothetical protein
MTQEGAPSAVTRARYRRRDCGRRRCQTGRSRRSHSRCQTACVSSFPHRSLAGGFLLSFASSLLPLGHAAPKMRGPAERREAYYLSCRARRARRHACEAWGVPRKTGTPPLGAPPWRCRPRNRSGPGTMRDPASRLLTASHCSWRATAPGVFVSAVYEPRSTPLPAPPAGSSPETPLMSEDGESYTIYSLRSQTINSNCSRQGRATFAVLRLVRMTVSFATREHRGIPSVRT